MKCVLLFCCNEIGIGVNVLLDQCFSNDKGTRQVWWIGCYKRTEGHEIEYDKYSNVFLQRFDCTDF